MRLFLIPLFFSLTVLATTSHNNETPPPADASNPEAPAQTNLSQAIDTAGVKDLFKDETKAGEDMEQLRALSKDQKDALKKAFEGSKDSNGWSASTKALKEAMDIMDLSDEKLAEELEKPKEGDDKSQFNQERMLAELKERMKNSSVLPSAQALKALEKLKSDERTKKLGEKLSNYKNLNEAEREKVRADLAAIAVRDKGLSAAYWDFVGPQGYMPAQNSMEKGFNESLKGDVKPYDPRYLSKDDVRAVFKDQSGKIFSVNGKFDENGKTDYEKFVASYKTMKPEERAKATGFADNRLTYHETGGASGLSFELKSTAGGKFTFSKDGIGDDQGKFTLDKSIQDKLHLKDPITTTATQDIRVWSQDAAGKTSVTSHQLYLYNAGIPYKEGQDGATLGIGYSGKDYFLYSTQGDFSNAHKLITEPDKRYNYNFATDDAFYMKRQSDGADWKLSFDHANPSQNSISPVSFSVPASNQTYIFQNGNWYYAPVGYGGYNYGWTGGTYNTASGGFYYGCST